MGSTLLLRICKNKEPKLGELSEACEFLTDFFIDTRYPVHWPSDVTKEEALKAKEATQKIKEKILQKLQMPTIPLKP